MLWKLTCYLNNSFFKLKSNNTIQSSFSTNIWFPEDFMAKICFKKRRKKRRRTTAQNSYWHWHCCVSTWVKHRLKRNKYGWNQENIGMLRDYLSTNVSAISDGVCVCSLWPKSECGILLLSKPGLKYHVIYT